MKRESIVALIIALAILVPSSVSVRGQTSVPELIRQAQSPGAIYRPVPLWWWDGDELKIERLRWQLDQLHEQGVDQVCLIYLAPLKSQPPYFTEDWWDLYTQMVDYAASLGMKVWLTDGIAWGSPFINNSVLEDNPDFRGQLLEQQSKDFEGPGLVQHEIPEGYEVTETIGAFAYAQTDNGIDLDRRHDLTSRLKGRKLEWNAPEGRWKIMIFYMKPMGFQGNMEAGYGRGYGIDYTNPEAMSALIRRTTGEYAKRAPAHVGKTIVGTFQDELVTHHHYGFPPYSKRFTEEFRKRMGYALPPVMGALYHDAGRLTDKVRCDYFEVLVQLFEEAFYKPYFDWHDKRNMMVSHDQFGRMDLVSQTWGYGDYFRTQSWFQAPGYDDWNQAVPGRNWRDAKLASSIAQLYGRPRVWVEALHSSGWGLDLQEQAMAVNENFIYGANIYDKHGFDYSTYGSWYNWAPPSAHYRMPYWMHYRTFADYVTRLSFLQSQGDYMADVGIFYPVHTIQANYSAAGNATDLAALTESYFWGAGETLLQDQIDFHFINDQAIQRATVEAGRLTIGGVSFHTVVLPPLTTIDRRTLAKLEELVRSGGALISLASLPNASPQAGRDDPEVRQSLEEIFGTSQPEKDVERSHGKRGVATFIREGLSTLAERIRSKRPVDMETELDTLMYQHRRAEDLDLYMFYNRSPEPARGAVTVRAAGAPYKFDSVDGTVTPIHVFTDNTDSTRMVLSFEPYEAYHVFFNRSPTPPLESSTLDQIDAITTDGGALQVRGWHQSSATVSVQDSEGRRSDLEVDVETPIALSGAWDFELRPTMDNRWGDFRRPPSQEHIGAEIRQFRYHLEEPGQDGLRLGWQQANFDDDAWEQFTYSVGPYVWVLGPIPNQGSEGVTIKELEPEKAPDPSRTYSMFGNEYRWRPYAFSQQFGVEKDPDYWDALGSKNQANPTFLELGQVDHFGLIYLFTHVYSPRETRALLFSPTSGYWNSHRIWVNGKIASDSYHRNTSEEFGGLVGVDLQKGWNTLLIKTNQRHSTVKLSLRLLDQQSALEGAAAPEYEGPPRLSGFAESDFVWDLYGDNKERVGWYRFTLPPGTEGFDISVEGDARLYVDGDPVDWNPQSGNVKLAEPLATGGVAALRIVHEPGKYAGAAIARPVRIHTAQGKIELGDWSRKGLLSYSGAAVYGKTFQLAPELQGKRLILDLGRVDASAAVEVNGQSAGTSAWAPYRFDITDLVKPGENRLEVTVANSLANHYLVGTPEAHVYEWQTESGLMGPVRIIPYTPVTLAVPGQ
jgi:hypothetical protein